MKKNEFNSNQEFEKILKEKMNELSTSVNCFDRISSRAFPEKDSDFSDCGFTVSDLENVTGRRRKLPALKLLSVAAAIVLCIGVIPKIALINSLKYSMDKCDNKNNYSNIILEINKEIQNGDYYICDLPLYSYLSHDVLVTPMYRCPFEECDENMNVRIFIKTIGGIRTNQIYAVEYYGTYSEDNIVAAAETGVNFSEKETAELENNFNYFFVSEDECSNAVSTAFIGNDIGALSNNNGATISAASFSDFSFYKKGKSVRSVRTDVVYYRYDNPDNYFYDLKVTDSSGEEIQISENSWKRSVDCDGNPVNADRNSNVMIRTDLFTGNYENSSDICYFTPEISYAWDSEQQLRTIAEHMVESHNGYNRTGTILSTIAFPEDTAFRRNLHVYLGKKVPVAEYPANNFDEVQYYTSLDMTSVNDNYISKNKITDIISGLTSEYECLEDTEKNTYMTESNKKLLEIEKEKVNRECEKWNMYAGFVDEGNQLQMQSAMEESEKYFNQIQEDLKRQQAQADSENVG